MTNVAVIIACYNRVSLTQACLRSLFSAADASQVSIRVYLADSSSPDGTAALISKEFPTVNVINSGEDVFWARGMRIAWESAQQSPYDFLLWLNDDVILEEFAFERLLETTFSAPRPSIAVGSTFDQHFQRTTYGGYKRGPWYHRLRLSRIHPQLSPLSVELSNGNILLIPEQLDRRLGGFPKGFRHSMADLFFTLRAHKRGIPLLLAPGYVGVCSENADTLGFRDPSKSASERMRILLSAKGLPFWDWVRLCSVAAGVTAPYRIIAPYLDVILSLLVEAVRRGPKR